jgi:hypothetical protein
MDLGKFTAPYDAGLLFFLNIVATRLSANSLHPNPSTPVRNPAHATYR